MQCVHANYAFMEWYSIDNKYNLLGTYNFNEQDNILHGYKFS
jgi:hypothetical protein